VLYYLSHASSPFCHGDRVSLSVQAQPTRPWSSYFKLCCPLDDRQAPLCPAFFSWDGVSQTFLLRLVWNCDPPDLSHPSSWDYRHEPQAPGSTFFSYVCQCIKFFFWLSFSPAVFLCVWSCVKVGFGLVAMELGVSCHSASVSINWLSVRVKGQRHCALWGGLASFLFTSLFLHLSSFLQDPGVWPGVASLEEPSCIFILFSSRIKQNGPRGMPWRASSPYILLIPSHWVG
jgi:hypothetical protein